MSEKCEVDGCASAVVKARRVNDANCEPKNKFCRKHLSRFLKHGTVEDKKFSHASLSERFWRNVDIKSEDECWEWKLSSKSKNGYGNIWDNEKKKSRLTHRVSYELTYGIVPDESIVMHTCDNPKCVNPKHLVVGTHKENGEDKARKGRSARNIFIGEQNPRSKLTLAQARFIKSHPEMKLTELAKMYCLSPNCIRGVRIGRTWKEA